MDSYGNIATAGTSFNRDNFPPNEACENRAPKEPEVQRRLVELEKYVEALNALWNSHCQRIQSVLRCEPCSPEKDPGSPSSSVALGDRILASGIQIAKLCRSMEDVTRRVEL